MREPGWVIVVPLRSSKRPPATGLPPLVATARIWALCFRSMSSDADPARSPLTPGPRVRVRLSSPALSTAPHDAPLAFFCSRTPMEPLLSPTPGVLGVASKASRPAPPCPIAQFLPDVRVWFTVPDAETRVTVFVEPVESARYDVT